MGCRDAVKKLSKVRSECRYMFFDRFFLEGR